MSDKQPSTQLNRQSWRSLSSKAVGSLSSLVAAIAFYTCIPIPITGKLEFQNVARLAPLVGLIIGGILGLLHQGLHLLGVPDLTRNAVIVIAWVAVTGGLHLDGAMDTADGLAVLDRQRRLEVMADSATGAFGAMAAIAILLLKVTALSDLTAWHELALPLAAGWGRWGQQVAIARYPYLKPTGKGAFHKAAIRSLKDVMPGFCLLLGLSCIPVFWDSALWAVTLGSVAAGSAIALLTAAWFNCQLGGHTGDTYGAVVEWTEALWLVVFTTLQS
nr:adenosylcobinamide-GDP ribazoletransferase [Leptolyngbya sp. FACHB-671]